MVATAVTEQQVYDWLADVADPEIPVVSVVDLGIVRQVDIGDTVTISLAPTYSGCPATEVIEQNVIDAIRDRGVADVRVRRVLSPPWTTEWISEQGRQKLLEYGIAPPQQAGSKRELLFGERLIPCPQCGSQKTELVSEFGSTACKAAYRCTACLEPFEYFKCI